MTVPLVSLCVPTFNGGRFVAEAIESALKQSAPPDQIELVVSDSGSTDDTLDIVRQSVQRSPFAVRILDKRTPGMVANWNAVVRAASGRWVKFLFQDDLLDADCVATMLRAATVDDRVTFAFCRRRLVIDKSARGGGVANSLLRHPNLDEGFSRLFPLQPGSDLLRDWRLLRTPLNKVGEPTTVLAHRETLIRCGLFNTAMRQLVDWEMWLRLMAAGYVAFVPHRLAGFRVHSDQMTARNNSSGGDENQKIEFGELTRTLSKPELYERLHPLARVLVRRHTPDRRFASYRLSPLDRFCGCVYRIVKGAD